MSDLNLAVIGNCSYGALVNQRGRIVWACFPHFDGDPMFCSLLDDQQGREDEGAGFWDVTLEGFASHEQAYQPQSAILSTILRDVHGGSLEIVDFAPRFRQYNRFFRPTTLVRIVRPLSGAPRIRIRLRPRTEYGAHAPEITSGSNHIRYVGDQFTLRLTTDAPVRFIREETAFVLEHPLAMILGPDETLTTSASEAAREFRERTEEYWSSFVRALSIPFEWQEPVIRAAITLKLCSYDDSGAILAAMTTSIPEAPNSGRNWDYRHCWLRDSYFVVHALNRLGTTETLEHYLSYITNLAVATPDGYLRPVYGINPERSLAEHQVTSLAGYRGMGPVRIGNQAWEQVQNDGYGSVVLSAMQVFYDLRLHRQGSERLFEQLEKLGMQAAQRYNQPDAGMWEFRGRQQVHTFSSVMCWAACDRLARIALRLGRTSRATFWRATADVMHAEIIERAWSPSLNRFVATFDNDGDGADASLLLLNELGFLAADDPRFASTVDGLAETLSNGGKLLYRYTEDEFGRPETAFLVCTFWYINALAALGRIEQARDLFEEMLQLRNPVGLFSEDIDPRTGELWGNFPQ
ncbi:MAG: glycoside hydrolase family 15 protein, partial [Gemmatimonadales bacterium]|nr:glycoside hydrolase family 15 protein [Gemmatimonadales bacterium]